MIIQGKKERTLIRTFFVLLLLFILTSLPVSAAIYEVANSSELNDALSYAQEGDVIFLEEGTYGYITVTDPGISIVGVSAKKVIFDNNGKNIKLKGDGCVLQDVTITDSPKGVEVEGDNCEIKGCVFDSLSYSTGINAKGDGLLFEDNTVKGASGSYFAINVLGADCIFQGNIFESNDCAGIGLYTNSKNNIIRYNTFLNNKYGIHVYSPGSGNRIYLNNFVGNDKDIAETSVSSTVYWNPASKISYTYKGTQLSGYPGNYWDSYTGSDSNKDGLGDSSYTISSKLGSDSHPLISGFSNYIAEEDDDVDLAPVKFTSSSSLVAQQPNRVKVTIKNSGDASSDYCKVVLLSGNDVLDDQILPPIKAGSTDEVAFTVMQDAGTYSLKVKVDSEGTIDESNENNNALSSTITFKSASIDSNWYQFHKDVQHTGYSPGSAPDTSDLLWVSDDIEAVSSSSPVVASGKVFVNTGYGDPDDSTGGSGDSEIVALDQYTGEVLGTYGAGSTYYGSWASPCYYNGDVSCARSDSVNGGNMIVNGKVYVGDYEGHHYYCSDQETGKELWSIEVEGLAMGTPAYSDGYVYLTSLTESGFDNGGYLYCVDADTGKLIWKLATTKDASGTPSIYNDVVYVTTYNWDGMGAIYAVDKDDGTVIWQQPIHRTDSCPAVAYGRVYVSGGCYGYSQIQTYCFDAASGELLWETDEDWFGLGGWTNSPTVADGKVFIGKPNDAFAYGAIYCLDAYTGKTIWSHTGGGAAAAISNGIVYTIGSDNKVYAYGSLEGSSDWNPWNDADSTNGSYISMTELQKAINCWSTGASAPETNEAVTLSRIQSLVHFWANHLEMEEGEQ